MISFYRESGDGPQQVGFHAVAGQMLDRLGDEEAGLLPGALIRRALAFVLLASALKLFDVPTLTTGIVLGLLLVLSGPIWMVLRRMHGFPAMPSQDPEPVAIKA